MSLKNKGDNELKPKAKIKRHPPSFTVSADSKYYKHLLASYRYLATATNDKAALKKIERVEKEVKEWESSSK